MIATAAEANPSCFSPTPLVDVEETLIPAYLRLVCFLEQDIRLISQYSLVQIPR